jgi:hypothetical protein
MSVGVCGKMHAARERGGGGGGREGERARARERERERYGVGAQHIQAQTHGPTVMEYLS